MKAHRKALTASGYPKPSLAQIPLQNWFIVTLNLQFDIDLSYSDKKAKLIFLSLNPRKTRKSHWTAPKQTQYVFMNKADDPFSSRSHDGGKCWIYPSAHSQSLNLFSKRLLSDFLKICLFLAAGAINKCTWSWRQREKWWRNGTCAVGVKLFVERWSEKRTHPSRAFEWWCPCAPASKVRRWRSISSIRWADSAVPPPDSTSPGHPSRSRPTMDSRRHLHPRRRRRPRWDWWRLHLP